SYGDGGCAELPVAALAVALDLEPSDARRGGAQRGARRRTPRCAILGPLPTEVRSRERSGARARASGRRLPLRALGERPRGRARSGAGSSADASLRLPRSRAPPANG